MSIGQDFLALIERLWQVETLNMWDPQEHTTLAYVLDQRATTSEYDQVIRQWNALLDKKDTNQFAWSVIEQLDCCVQGDESFTQKEKEQMTRWKKAKELAYIDHCISGVGFIQENHAPSWFFQLFHVYMVAQKHKRELQVMDYLTNSCQLSQGRATASYEKLLKHPDILNEFAFYIQEGRFKECYPITAQGYSARNLNESTKLTVLGAYNFLIYLREFPAEAVQRLKAGLPNK